MAEATTTPTTTPEANLALRYGYDALNPRNKDIADRVTALLIAYPDIVKLQDPKQQQDFIDRIAKSQSGKEMAAAFDGAGSEFKSMFEKLRGLDPTGLLSAAKSSSDAAQSVAGIANAASKGMGIAVSPFTISAAGLGELYNQSKVAWNTMTPEQAREVGTAYASTMQARETERAEKGTLATAFTSFGGAWAVAKALFSTALDFASGLPVIGEWIAKTFGASPTRTFAENLNRHFVEADITVAREEMTKLGQRNGIDYPAMASATTQETVLQNRAGQDATTTPPSAANPVPSLKDVAKDANGNPVVAETDRVAALNDAKKKAGEAVDTKVNETFAGTGGSGAQVAAGIGGTAIAVQGLRGVAEGTARQWVERPGVRSEKLADKVNTLAQKIASAEEAAPKTSALQFWRKTPEQLAGMKDELTALKAQAVKEGQTAAARAANASSFTKAAVAETHGANLVEKAWNAPRVVGRWMGAVPGIVGEKFIELTGRGAVKGAELASKAPAAIIEATPSIATATGGVARAFGTFVAPALESFNLITGIATGDERKVFTANASILTITGGVVAGAVTAVAVGAVGVAAAPFVATGLAVGGIATIGTNWAAGRYYDSQHPAAPAATPTTPPAPETKPEQQVKAAQPAFTPEQLSAAEAGVIAQAKMAVGRSSATAGKGLVNFNLGTGFASVNQTAIGNHGLPEASMPASAGLQLANHPMA